MDNNLILVTGSYDHTLVYWDVNQIKEQKRIEYGEKQIVNRIEISPNKKYLGAAASNSFFYYDIPSQSSIPIQVFDQYTNNVTALGFQKDSLWAYTCSEDGTTRVHDLKWQKNITARSFTSKEPNNSVCLHPNEVELIVADQSGFMKVYDLRMEQMRFKMQITNEVGLRSVAITQTGNTLLLADSQGYLYSFSLPNGDITETSQFTKQEAHQDYILKTIISNDSNYVATCSADKTLKIFELSETGQLKFHKTIYGHSKWVWDCAFSCDNEYIISVGSDCKTKIWQIEQGTFIREYTSQKQSVNCLALNDVNLEN